MRKLCVDVRVVSVTLLQACNSGGGIFVVRHLLASSNIINCYNKKMSKPWNPQWNGWVNGWMKLNIHRTAILHKVGCLVGHIFSLKTPTEVIMHLLKPHLVMTTFEVWLLFARNFYPEPFFSSQLTSLKIMGLCRILHKKKDSFSPINNFLIWNWIWGAVME